MLNQIMNALSKSHPKLAKGIKESWELHAKQFKTHPSISTEEAINLAAITVLVEFLDTEWSELTDAERAHYREITGTPQSSPQGAPASARGNSPGGNEVFDNLRRRHETVISGMGPFYKNRPY